ncbi:MAG: carboxypeptidase-like regulatory domain-containing protein [Planctomycetota bacterium]
MRRLVLAILLAAVTWGIWMLLSHGDDPGPAPGHASTASPSQGEARSTQAARNPTSEATPTRAAARTEETARDVTPGRLHVAVVLARDNRPLPHTAIHARAKDGRPPEDSHRVQVTDADGIAVFDAIPGGLWSIECDRGPKAEVEIVARATKELRLAVEAGVDVLLRSIDAQGAPVPHAEVLMWPANRILDIPLREDGTPIGTTDVQGELRVLALPSIAGNGTWFAARHPSFGVSDPSMVPAPKDDSDRVEREITLQLGATGTRLDVRVTDEQGHAIGDAVLTALPFDTPRPSIDQVPRRLRHAFRSAHTDAQGRGVLGPLLPGSYLLRATASGFAPARRHLTIGDTILDLDLVLPRGARLGGHVIDAVGRPVSDVQLTVQIEPEGRTARSAADGSFTLAGLHRGTAQLVAHAEGFRDATAPVELHAGETTTTEVQMQALPHLRARLVDARDTPLTGWSIDLECEPANDRRAQERTRTDREGRIDVALASGIDYRLLVFEPGIGLPLPLDTDRVRAQEGELTIRVPDASRATAWIDAALVDAQGHSLLERYAISLSRERRFAWVGNGLSLTERETSPGHFKLGPVPPGRYRLDFASQLEMEFARDGLELRAGEVLALGRIEPPAAGILTVEVTLEDGVEPDGIRVQVDSDTSSDFVEIDAASLRASRHLLPGSYEVSIFGTGFRWPHRKVVIAVGETVTLREALRPAVRFPLRLFMPDGEHGATFEVRDARGEHAFETELETDATSETNWPFLDLGSYEVEATGKSGRHYHGAFRVDTLEPRTTPLDLHVIAR